MQPSSPERRSPRLAGAALLLGALIAAIGALIAGASDPAAAAPRQSPPNIVVLFTDDQEPASMRIMKTVDKELKQKGTRLKRFYYNFPLCCPSRTTMLTGQYAHNHGVLSNSFPTGGFSVFDDLHAGNSLNDWLQHAGYTTGYIGKFLNEYAEPDEYGNLPTYVPPGWNDWRVLAPSRAQYFNYTLNQNGTRADFGQKKSEYSTDLFTVKAKRFIRRGAKQPNPFFLMLGYAAPHGGGGGEPGRSCNRGAVPAPRHLGTLKNLARKKPKKFGFPPSFNEADTTDKPSPIANLAPLSDGQASDLKRKRRCAWESLLAVDESVGALLEELKRTGEKKDTYVFFLSDNGYLRGEHRIRNQKRYLYEESARGPLIVRGPGVARNEQSNNLVTNADIVPTLLQISGAQPGEVQDGESLLPTLAEPKREDGRAILLEAYAGSEITGVRTSRYLYTEWDTDQLLPERELYDTYADPYQMNNLARDPAYAPIVADLGRQLDDLIVCEGAECRGRPEISLSVAPGGQGKGCVFEPLVARVDSASASSIATVEFRAAGKLAAVDNAAPFEAALPTQRLRKQLPEPGEVLARALFKDGRRVAATAPVKLCK